MLNAMCDTFGGGPGAAALGGSVVTDPRGFGNGLVGGSAVTDPLGSGHGLGGGAGGTRPAFGVGFGAGVSFTTFGVLSLGGSLRKTYGLAFVSAWLSFRTGRPSRHGGTFSNSGSCPGDSFSSSGAGGVVGAAVSTQGSLDFCT